MVNVEVSQNKSDKTDNLGVNDRFVCATFTHVRIGVNKFRLIPNFYSPITTLHILVQAFFLKCNMLNVKD